MKNYIVAVLIFILGTWLSAQEFPLDSLDNVSLDEVIIISKTNDKPFKGTKALASLDAYLEQSGAVNMIKRGAYAWEPMLQGMASERSVITIDGMRIYGACTDKMDPITSYVEITNFSKAEINSGSSGAVHGGTIAGSIDLVRKKGDFSDQGLGGSVFTGYETVNKQKILGAGLNYSKTKYFANLDFIWRDADNFKAGGNLEIPYSQFTKYNLSAIAGVKLTEDQWLEASVIYDRASDIGYPALPMDVSLAEATITSLQYTYRDLSDHLNLWETKLYYNKVKHVMDDSQRPDVPIRMDMPGRSETAGFFSNLQGNYNKHNFGLTLSAHINNSFAEMTMYPENQDEADMYMMTWPDVNTMYAGLFANDNLALSHHLKLNFSAGIAVHHNSLESEFGLNSLQIYYPDLERTETRSIKSLNSDISFHHNRWMHSFGMGFSERAPTVSEAYGFYLFNSFDNFDYIGNPFLKNEKSLQFFVSTQYNYKKLSMIWRGNYFQIYNYIIGVPDENLIPMTLNADGVKVYEGLKSARIYNTEFDLEYRFIPGFAVNGRLSFRYGEDFEGEYLPLIQPFNYHLSVRFEKRKWVAEAGLDGSAKYKRYNLDFGETPKDSFLIMNAAVSKVFNLNRQRLTVKMGAENIFDKKYITFLDWNNIPRPGRNVFLNLIYNL